jgi:hypothetical protein
VSGSRATRPAACGAWPRSRPPTPRPLRRGASPWRSAPRPTERRSSPAAASAGRGAGRATTSPDRRARPLTMRVLAEVAQQMTLHVRGPFAEPGEAGGVGVARAAQAAEHQRRVHACPVGIDRGRGRDGVVVLTPRADTRHRSEACRERGAADSRAAHTSWKCASQSPHIAKRRPPPTMRTAQPSLSASCSVAPIHSKPHASQVTPVFFPARRRVSAPRQRGDGRPRSGGRPIVRGRWSSFERRCPSSTRGGAGHGHGSARPGGESVTPPAHG